MNPCTQHGRHDCYECTSEREQRNAEHGRNESLERIAVALERIAARLDKGLPTALTEFLR